MKADEQFGENAVDPQTAEFYLEVGSCLPRLAPRRATDVCARAAEKRRGRGHGLRCLVQCSRGGRAERLGTSNPTKTRPHRTARSSPCSRPCSPRLICACPAEIASWYVCLRHACQPACRYASKHASTQSHHDCRCVGHCRRVGGSVCQCTRACLPASRCWGLSVSVHRAGRGAQGPGATRF